jgi:alpha-1,3-rhamnosyl/mannosyltransferase
MSLLDVLPLDIPGHFPQPREEQAYRRRIQSDIDRADLVLTISEYSRRRIVEEFRVRHDPCVIPLGVYLPEMPGRGALGASAPLERASGDTIERPFFLFAGGFDPRKRVELAVSAVCDSWRLHGLRIPLLVAGTVRLYSRELERALQEGREMGAVKTIGYVSDAQLQGLYAQATAMIYPSRFEGFGLPPLEAMANGCPVITCRETSIPEVCGEAALYLDLAREKASLVEALVLLATNELRRQEMIAAGRERATRFAWRSAAEIYLGALARVTSGGAPPL